MKFDPKAAEPSKKKRSRKRNISWFNPPFNSSVRSNIAGDFLKLIDECFPLGHPLRKLINRNTVKVSYSCTPNMATIISSRNENFLSVPPTEKRTCNCPKNNPCPLDGKCLSENLIYQATVTQADQTTNCYIGLTSTTFKARLGTHKNSFKDEDANQTSLSKFVRKLKQKNVTHKIGWKMVDRARPFSPVTGKCGLCNREMFFIMFRPTLPDLNSRSEIYANCRHKAAALLIKRERKRKKAPG